MRLQGSFFVAVLLWAGSVYASGPKAHSEVGVRFDCLHNATSSRGSTQSCMRLSGLKFTHHSKIDKKTHFSFTIDPFGSPAKSLAHQAFAYDNPLPTIDDSSLGIITDFSLRWQVRPRMAIAITSYGGATPLSDIHGLSLGSRFQYSGWNQLALTTTYTLGAKAATEVELAIGNGEGEPTKNLDPQQFGGLRITHNVFKGLHVFLGASLDGNHYGSEATKWAYENNQDDIIAGFSTRRVSVGIYSDGLLAAAPGLKLAASFHSVVAKDLDKKVMSINTDSFNNPNLTLRNLYVEDPTGAAANDVETSIFDVSLSYAIMAENFIALNYETRDVDTGKVLFFEDEGGTGHKKISQAAYTAGLSLAVAHKVRVNIEYHSETYNKSFKSFYYEGPGGKKSKVLDLFNARIMYHW